MIKVKHIVTCYQRSQPIIGLLLGNSFVNTQQYWSVARQQPARNNVSIVGSGVFYVFRPEVISRHRQFQTVQFKPLLSNSLRKYATISLNLSESIEYVAI
jgi:hypothetical protein